MSKANTIDDLVAALETWIESIIKDKIHDSDETYLTKRKLEGQVKDRLAELL